MSNTGRRTVVIASQTIRDTSESSDPAIVGRSVRRFSIGTEAPRFMVPRTSERNIHAT
jgi:hypothetical protein